MLTAPLNNLPMHPKNKLEKWKECQYCQWPFIIIIITMITIKIEMEFGIGKFAMIMKSG